MSKTFAAIGIFDGVHRGHASIISTAAREAAKDAQKIEAKAK